MLKKNLKIGHVDLDTSHPEAWIGVLRSLGYDNIHGVYDGGTVHPAGYAKDFAERLCIPKVYESLDEMAEDVDIAFIHTSNWDLHIERAKPFIEAGRSVFIDKPMAGNLKDLNTITEWSKKGCRITGGSSLRYCYELKQYHEELVTTLGEIQYIFAGAPTDEFNYGIHAYSLVQGLMGNGIACAKQIGSRRQHLVELEWKDGRKGILSVGETQGFYKTYATIVGSKGICHLEIDNSKIYRALLERAMPYLIGESNDIVPMDELCEIEKAAFAARVSWQTSKKVYLADLQLDDKGYDGAAFADFYRLLRIK